MVNFENKLKYDVSDLQKLMRLLRGPDGCPWDAEQTHDSILRNLLEEAYEAVEAIGDNDTEHMVEELGDVLLQVVFHADIAEAENRFNLDDIADATCRKLLRRHPHVFGEFSAKDGEQSLTFWEDVKRQENKHETVAQSMNAIARSLPSLWRAEKVQKKAQKIGFDWQDYTGALDAIHSETQELEDAIASKNVDNLAYAQKIEEELGDLIFSAVNLARFFKIDPEEALNKATLKFITRFSALEDLAKKRNKELTDMTLGEMEDLYKLAKLEK